MLSTEEVFGRVVAEGTRRRRRRRTVWSATAVAAVVAVVAGGLAVWPDSTAPRTTVRVAAPTTVGPPTTLDIPATTGSLEVRVPAPLPSMPATASVWSDAVPDAAFVHTLATALGVGGTVVASGNGFTVTGGEADLQVMPANGVPGWRFEMGPCSSAACRPPAVTPTFPVPTVETRDAPDHPPFDAAPVAADAARRIATVLGDVTIEQPLQMAPGEWWANFDLVEPATGVAASSFQVHIEPDGSVRLADGFLDRAGSPGPTRALVGVEDGLRRLATSRSNANEVIPARLPISDPGATPALVVTGVRMGRLLTDEGFVPAYVFTLDTGNAVTISAI